MSLPIVVVVGATGVQGGSVVNSLLETKQYRVRGLTRNLTSKASAALQARGVEMVAADLNDLESLKKTFTGADFVFGVTNFWDPSIVAGDKTLEEKQGKNIGLAAKAANIKFLIFSSLADVSKESDGKLKHVLHFDGKNRVEQFIRSLGVPCAFVYVGFYFTNLLYFFTPRKNEKGEFVMTTNIKPDLKCPFVDTAGSTGPVVAKILQNHQKYNGEIFPVVDGMISMAEGCDIMSKASGKPVVYQVVSDEVFKSFPGVDDEMMEMNAWFNLVGYMGKHVDPMRSIKEFKLPTRSMADFMKKNFDNGTFKLE